MPAKVGDEGLVKASGHHELRPRNGPSKDSKTAKNTREGEDRRIERGLERLVLIHERGVYSVKALACRTKPWTEQRTQGASPVRVGEDALASWVPRHNIDGCWSSNCGEMKITVRILHERASILEGGGGLYS